MDEEANRLSHIYDPVLNKAKHRFVFISTSVDNSLAFWKSNRDGVYMFSSHGFLASTRSLRLKFPYLFDKACHFIHSAVNECKTMYNMTENSEWQSCLYVTQLT